MKSGKYTLDRFEGDIAVLLFRENESIQIEVSKDRLEGFAQEGDILGIKFSENSNVDYIEVLVQETEEARTKAKSLLEKLINKKK